MAPAINLSRVSPPSTEKRGLLHMGVMDGAFPLSFGPCTDRIRVSKTVAGKATAGGRETTEWASLNFFLARLSSSAARAVCLCDFLLRISIYREVGIQHFSAKSLDLGKMALQLFWVCGVQKTKALDFDEPSCGSCSDGILLCTPAYHE